MWKLLPLVLFAACTLPVEPSVRLEADPPPPPSRAEELCRAAGHAWVPWNDPNLWPGGLCVVVPLRPPTDLPAPTR